MSDHQFSVYWWDRNGARHHELSWGRAEQAVSAVKRLTAGPASILGIVHRVIITDGGDCTTLEWKIGEGFTYPPQLRKGQANG